MAQNNSVFIHKPSNNSHPRPKLTIDMDQISNLRSLGFVWKKIANLL